MISSGGLPRKELKNLDFIPSIIDKTFPVPGRFRKTLPSDIAELSRLLTNNRGARSLSYLSRPNFLSAYLRYFLPWNLSRLCITLPELDLELKPGDTITDLGSGPATFALALWIARPDLRGIPLKINCVDRCVQVLEAGKKLFHAVSGSGENAACPWKINLIRKNIDFRRLSGPAGEKADLVCAVNLFNEIYEKIPHNNTEKLKAFARDAALLLRDLAKTAAPVFTMEPGVPQAGRFISLLRDELKKSGYLPSSPCPHAETCPLAENSHKKKWCHFSYDTSRAPEELHRLSSAAGLAKERLVFSYLFAGVKNSKKEQAARVISDAFPLPAGSYGRYACSDIGLVLFTGEKKQVDKIESGSLIPLKSYGNISPAGRRDIKSNAIILAL